jgi:ATP-binding cassette subfamily C protein
MEYLPHGLGALLLVYVGVVSLRAMLEVAEAHATARVESHGTLHLREELYRALVQTRWEVLARLRGARIAHVLTQELEHVSLATNQVLRGLLEFLIAGTYGLAAILISPTLALAAAASALLLLAVLWTQQRDARDDGDRITKLGEQIFTGATEHIATLKSAKAAGIAERVADRFVGTARAYSDGWVRAQRRGQMAHATMSIGAAASLAVIVYLAVERLHLPAASLLVLLFVYARLVARLVALQSTVLLANRFLPALLNVHALLDELDTACDPESASSGTPIRVMRALQFERVSYRYPGASEPALRNVSFCVPAGAVTAIVGASGAGKSTIADIALLLLDPESGRVLVDGEPISAQHAADWRAAVSYLPQETQLFHDSVRENVRWVVPDASDEDIAEALRLAGAEPLLRRLPQGLGTVIGDRGTLLSGGDRQRIALARALLRRPRLLVLDEATAALDVESETAIRATLRELTPAITVIVITHRLHSARLADHVIAVDAGTVVAEGTWASVVEGPSSRLAQQWQAQFSGGIFDDAPVEHLPLH